VNVPAVETQADREGWPETLGSNSEPVRASPWRAAKSDEQLARAAGRGDVAAFEALYERHHRALLSFSRHMLGRAHDAEDVVQHAFLAADRAFRDGKVPKAVRAWLYTVARNRCVSLLRARREDAGLPDAGVPSTENLAADVEQREDLRALLGDLRRLPDDQRAALLLTELGDLTHVEVAKVIGVRAGKVKALVFQAREALLASAYARAIPCQSIREELATANGAALRRRHLKHHLAQCDGCAAFAADVRTQRAALAALLPVVPTLALRESVFAGLASGGAAAGAGAGIGAGILANSTAAKLFATLAVTGAAAGGGVAVTARDDRPATPQERKAERGGSAPAPAPPAVPAAAAAPAETGAERRQQSPEGARAPVGRRRAADRDARRPGRRDRGERRQSAPGAADAPRQPGEKGRATAPGQMKPTPENGNGNGKESAPGQLKPPKAKAVPKGQAKPKAPKLVPAAQPPKPEPTPKPRTKPPTAGPKPDAAPAVTPDAVITPPAAVEQPPATDNTPSRQAQKG
jgi:RNA polymerase sigma factor (sigma-70 family)